MVSTMDLNERSGKRPALLWCAAMELIAQPGDDVVEDWYDQIDLFRRLTGG